MVRIQQAQNTVNVDRTGLGYYDDRTNGDAFGVGIAKAEQRLGESSLGFLKAMASIHQDVQRTRALELSNYIDELERTELNDPQNGYYSKLGADAMAKPEDPHSGANGVLEDIDQKIEAKQKELGLTWGYGYKAAQYVKTKKMNTLYRGATTHELKQTKEWGVLTNDEAKVAAISKGILHRDDEEQMKTALGTGKAMVRQKAGLLHWDADTTRIELAKFESDYHSAIVSAYVKEGSLKGKEYFEAHKEQILPDSQEKLMGAVRQTELNYVAKSVSDRLVNVYGDDEAGAYAEIDKIENAQEREAIDRQYTAKINRKRTLDNRLQSDSLDDFYDRVNEQIQSGQVPSYDDIPMELNGKNQMAARDFIDKMTTKGEIDTNNDTYLDLYEMSTTNAQGFAALNLAPYRPYLSASDYKSFQKRQKDIQNMTPTQLVDNDQVIKNGLKAMGFDFDKKTGEVKTSAFGKHSDKNETAYVNIFNAYVKELELQKGKNLTREELGEAQRQFTEIYKEDPKAYQKGFNNQVDFIRNLTNDLEAAEAAKKAPLTMDEKNKVVAERVSKSKQEENTKMAEAINQASRPPQVGDTWFGHKITSTYGPRKTPTKGASSNHRGVDLAYNYNEKIGAFASGKVEKVGLKNKGYGNYVDIRSADGTLHRYAHCNSINVKQGQDVVAGQQIARAGSSGVSTGPHLHYEQIVGNKSVNPLGKKIATNKTENKKDVKIAEGTIIKNPKTNVRMVMKGGKWTKIN